MRIDFKNGEVNTTREELELISFLSTKRIMRISELLNHFSKGEFANRSSRFQKAFWKLQDSGKIHFVSDGVVELKR